MQFPMALINLFVIIKIIFFKSFEELLYITVQLKETKCLTELVVTFCKISEFIIELLEMNAKGSFNITLMPAVNAAD